MVSQVELRIKSYLAAVRHSQVALGVGDMPQLEYVSEGKE